MLEQLKYRAAFNLRKHIPYAGKFPVHIDLELAGKCQLACTMCPYGTGDFDRDKQGMMPWPVAETAIAQSAFFGAKSIKFNFRGEPGLSNMLPRAIRMAKKHDIVETAINTNMLAFSERRIVQICDAGLDLIIISIDGATRNVYEKIRKNADWFKLLNKLNFLHGIENKPRIRIQMVKQELNAHQVEYFKYKFSKYTSDIVIQSLREDNSGERRRCPQPWQRLIVAWDGKVFACCSNWDNEFPIGKFPESDLFHLWNNNPLLEKLREHATCFNSFPCDNCTVGASYK